MINVEQNTKNNKCLRHLNLCHSHHTQLSFLGHLGLMHNVAQDLLFLEQLIFVQCLLLLKVVVMLLLVLLQFI